MNKKKTIHPTNNQVDIKKEVEQNIEKKLSSDIDRIKDIAQSIADNSYKGHYTIEKYSKSQYRFGFGISESSDIPSMFTGNSVKEAMYRAVDSELIKELKAIKGCDIVSRKELIDLVQESQQKCEASDIEYKKMLNEIDTLKQEQKQEIDTLKQEQRQVKDVINRFKNRWKDNVVMKPFKKKVETWEKKKLSLFIAFLLEHAEGQSNQLEMVSDDISSFKKIEHKKEKSLLAGAKVLASFHTGHIFEPVWKELQDTVIDGKWHFYPEAESIIMKYYQHLTIATVRQKRQSYFYFARDKKYCDIRGGKDYLFEWKQSGGGNKFRFTVIEEKKDETSIIEKKKDETSGASIDSINKHAIYEKIRDRFVSLFCDGQYHDYPEAIELFKKYDKYKKYKKKESFYPLIRAYMQHVNKFYQIVKCNKDGVRKFKFDGKGHGLNGVSVTAEKDVKCTRCGRIIHYGKRCMQVDNMFYHLDCYDIYEHKAQRT